MSDKHYNPAIAARLRVLVDGRQWSSITQYLGKLSNAQFRTAGYMLGEVYMPQLSDDDFWVLAQHLVDTNSKAFLVTVLKSWCSSMDTRSLVPTPSFFMSLKGREEDQRKALQVMLPVLVNPDDAISLMSAMSVDDVQKRIQAYLHDITPVTAFLLVKALHEVEDDRAFLVRVAYFLIKQNTNLSFNLSSLICSHFGLDEVKGVFSLNLQPFELSRLITDFNAFKKAMSM